MQNPNRIPELANRERFIKRVLANGGISFVAGDEGWACVPFKQDSTRDVVLFWSSQSEARRWADVVATNPQVHNVTLDSLLADVLPMLAERRCLVGTDWSTDPTDPILDTSDLTARIWRERGEQFMTGVRESKTLWLLESASGPASLPSLRQDGKEYLPVWTSREAAAQNIAGSWAVKRPIAVSLAVFADRYLPFIEQRGWFVGPEPMPGAGTKEMSASEFSMRAFPTMTLSRLRAV
ncbi:MAG: DUF2750 domain-containing protein [Hyphomicrobiaceae bacterium]